MGFLLGFSVGILAVAVGVTHVKNKEGGADWFVVASAIIMGICAEFFVIFSAISLGNGVPSGDGFLEMEEVYEVGALSNLNGKPVSALRRKDQERYYFYDISAPSGSGYVQVLEEGNRKILRPFPPNTQPAE